MDISVQDSAGRPAGRSLGLLVIFTGLLQNLSVRGSYCFHRYVTLTTSDRFLRALASQRTGKSAVHADNLTDVARPHRIKILKQSAFNLVHKSRTLIHEAGVELDKISAGKEPDKPIKASMSPPHNPATKNQLVTNTPQNAIDLTIRQNTIDLTIRA